MRLRRRSTPLAVLAVLVVALSACGGEEPDPGTDSAEGTTAAAAGGVTTVTLGLIPIIDVAPVHVGMAQNFFEEEGLELELSTGQGGAAILPTYLEVTPELAEQLILSAWDTEVSEATFAIFAELGQHDGLLAGDVDLDALLGR
ncbi:MAG: ABC transporter substrate-binding protein [Georgenia sp.]